MGQKDNSKECMTEEEVESLIEKRLKKNLKIELILIVLAAVLGASGVFLVQHYFSEKNAIISSAYEFKDDRVILTIHNDADYHSPTIIKIYGKVGDEEKLLLERTDHVLSKDNPLTVEIPVKATLIKIPVKQRPPDEREGHLGGVTIPKEEINKIFDSNHLAYKIDCDKCPKKNEWRLISIRKFSHAIIFKEIEEQLYFEVEAELYSWK